MRRNTRRRIEDGRMNALNVVRELSAIVVLGVIAFVVWKVVRRAMGTRFGHPDVPTGTLWWEYERRFFPRKSEEQAPSLDMDAADQMDRGGDQCSRSESGE
ncbi:MAG: hypothetical protein BGO02_14330, partial [Brevundimonas sp. 67-6]